MVKDDIYVLDDKNVIYLELAIVFTALSLSLYVSMCETPREIPTSLIRP